MSYIDVINSFVSDFRLCHNDRMAHVNMYYPELLKTSEAYVSIFQKKKKDDLKESRMNVKTLQNGKSIYPWHWKNISAGFNKENADVHPLS